MLDGGIAGASNDSEASFEARDASDLLYRASSGSYTPARSTRLSRCAFRCRGCFTRFYRRRCLVCERDLSRDPMTGEAVKLGRKFCGEMPERAQALPARL